MSRDAAKKLAVCGLLLLAVIAVFGQTVRHGFVNFDDNAYVCENPHLQAGLSGAGICWALTTTRSSMWGPLTWTSYLLDFQLHGLKPWGYHLTNVLLHAATTIVLFLVLRGMTGDFWPSALVAAVFAIHPLHVESVAWVAERKGLLSGLCFVLSLGAYLHYARRPFSILRYLPVVALFALGLMAKPDMVTLPFLLVLLDYWPLGRVGSLELGAGGREQKAGNSLSAGALREPVENSDERPQGFDSVRNPPFSQRFAPRTLQSGSPLAPTRAPYCGMWRLVGEKVPLLLLAALSCIMAPRTQGKAVAALETVPMTLRLENAAVSYAAYLGKFVWPTNLAVLYPLSKANLPMGKVAAALLLLVAISAAVLACWRRYPYLFVGWLWYLGMLVPMSGLVQVGSHAMADRYTYLPHIGLAIALAWTARRVSRSWPYRAWACGIGAAAALAVLTACAWRQAEYWRDSETLWTHTLACTARNPVAHSNFGNILAGRGQIDEAITQYRKALEIRPNFLQAQYNLGVLLAARGRPGELGEAHQHFQTALALATGPNDHALAEAIRDEIRRHPLPAPAHNGQ